MTNKTSNKNRTCDLSQEQIEDSWIRLAQDRPSKSERNLAAKTRLFDIWQHNSYPHESELCDIPSMTKNMHTLVAENLNLHNIVGVQEMAKPIGLIYALQYTKQTESERGQLEIISGAIEAKSRTMNAQYNIDMINEAVGIHGMDLQSEIMQAVASEVCRELHSDFMDLIYVIGTDVNFRIDMEEAPKDIVNKILTACDVVALNSRRGKANKVILPYELCVYILPYVIEHNMFEYQTETNSMGDLLQLGTLFNDIELYTSIRNTVVLVGYKGKSETDTGIIFCPYQLNLFVATRPNTDEHRVLMRARYAVHTVSNASDYYVSIQVR